LIKFTDLHLSFTAGMYALTGINLDISPGEFVYVIGRSGAGKSSLLKLVYAEVLPTRGVVKIEGRDIRALGRSQIPYLRRQIGIVFQDYKLIGNITVFDNVKLALDIFYMRRSEAREHIYPLLKRVGLFEKRDELVCNLSGGEKQRVAIVRALINKPKIILADEPTGNLDIETADNIMMILNEARLAGATILLATHDETIRKRYVAREILLEKGRIASDTGGNIDE